MRALLLLLALNSAGVFAQNDSPAAPSESSRPRQPPAKPTELLRCKPASSNEEAKAREAAEAANFSDHEVLSRLIFSEALATGYWAKKCEAADAVSLMDAIGWMIINRVDRYSPKRDDPKPDAIFHEVFASKQFTPSFSGKGNNIFAVMFLCPYEAEKYLTDVKSKIEAYSIYLQSKEVAARILDKYTRTGIDPKYSKIRNVFFPYSDFGGAVRPEWAKDPDPTKNKGFVKIIEGQKPCAEFYRR